GLPEPARLAQSVHDDRAGVAPPADEAGRAKPPRSRRPGDPPAGLSQPRAGIRAPHARRVERWRKAAGRHRARLRVGSRADPGRRAGVVAGRVDPGGGAEPAGALAGGTRHGVPVHLARSGGRRLSGGHDRGDVPGRAGGDDARRVAVAPAAPPLHRSADRRDPSAGPRPPDRWKSPARRAARAGRRAARLPLPPPLPAQARPDLRDRCAAVAASGQRPLDQVPHPAGRSGCYAAAGARLMGRFLVRRAIFMLGTLVLTTVLVFLLTRVLPGDVARVLLGREASPEAVAAKREELGLNDPLPVQYVTWAVDFVRGDWGQTFAS